MPGTMTLKH